MTTKVYLVQKGNWASPVAKTLTGKGANSVWYFGVTETDPFRIYSYDADELHRDLATSVRDVTEDVLRDLYSNFDENDFWVLLEEAKEWSEAPWALRTFYPSQTADVLIAHNVSIPEAA